MTGPTPWSASAEAIAPDRIRVSIMLSTDPGPMREFHPFLDLELDEAHATELLGSLAFALRDLRALREAGRGSKVAPILGRIR